MRQQKITLGEMRSTGLRGVLIYCADYKCSHYITAMADRWADDVRQSDIKPRFVCSACGKRGVDVRSDFHWDKPGGLTRGYGSRTFRLLALRGGKRRNRNNIPTRLNLTPRRLPQSLGGNGRWPRCFLRAGAIFNTRLHMIAFILPRRQCGMLSNSLMR
jgi:hypothetical protein